MGGGKKEMNENTFFNISVQAKPTGLMDRHCAISAICV